MVYFFICSSEPPYFEFLYLYVPIVGSTFLRYLLDIKYPRLPFVFILSFFTGVRVKLIRKILDCEVNLICRWRGAEFVES